MRRACVTSARPPSENLPRVAMGLATSAGAVGATLVCTMCASECCRSTVDQTVKCTGRGHAPLCQRLPCCRLLLMFLRMAESVVTKRRDGWACRGNQKLEQDTPEGTHTHKKRYCTNAGQIRYMSLQWQPRTSAQYVHLGHLALQEVCGCAYPWYWATLCGGHGCACA